MTTLIERVAAADACIQKFAGQPFEWGKTDCVRIAAFAVKAQGIKVSLSKLRPYKSEIGAIRALKAIVPEGNLVDAMQAQGFAEIAPAAAWPGDIVAIPGPEPFGCALFVQLSNGRVLGPTAEGTVEVCEPTVPPLTAWRVA